MPKASFLCYNYLGDNMNFKNIIEEFIKNNYTISFMESCTGGGVSNSLTNCERSSEIFKFGAVTYSNEYKIKMGVDPDIISKYSVYSAECADSMSKAISKYTNSTYGVGITGKLKREDINNKSGDNDIVYISVYNSKDDSYKTDTIKCIYDTREENKELVINKIIGLLEEL